LLKIDLLPSHFAAARAAKSMLVVMVLVLLLTILGCFGMLMMKNSELAQVTREHEDWKQKADEVRGLETKAGAKEALAAPIDAKVTFIEDADGCGEQWFDALEKVNRYIYAQARVTAISIRAPNIVHFEVDVPDTTACGRFVLNLIRCPDISGIRVGGAPPSGEGIGPNARASGGGGGAAMGGMPGMGEPGMGGMPGGPPGGMPGGPGMGMMPGMGGGAPSAGASTAAGPIHLSVDATLNAPLSTPAPGGGAAGAAPGGMGAMGGAMPGMAGGMPGMAGPGGPTSTPPGAGPPGAGPPGAGPPGGPKGGGGGDDGGGGGDD